MRDRQGGFIGVTVTPTTSAASGIWTLRDAERFERGGTWPVPFAPTDISGLQLWLDASSADTLYDDTSGGSLVAADGAVARWEDKSGNGRHATQSTSGNRPLRKTATQNGKDTLEFDGSDDALSVPSSTATFKFLHNAAYTVFAVFKSGTNSDPNRLSPIVTTISTYGGNPGISLHHEDRSGIGNDSISHTVKTEADNFISYFTANDTFASNTYGVMTAKGNITSGTASQQSTIYRNGTSIGSNALLVTGSSNNSQANLTVGAAASQFWFLGNIAEIVIYDAALGDTDRARVETYLMSKWNIA